MNHSNKYKVAVIYNGSTAWIEQAVTSMSWSGSRSEASRTLSLECVKVNGKTDFPAGSIVAVYTAGGSELMRYIIIKKSKARSSTTIKYTCRDMRWWLLKNKVDKKYENMTAAEVFVELCVSLGISVGAVEDTEIRFPVLHFIKKTPWDIIITALTETRKLNGRKFVVKAMGGSLGLVEKKSQVHKWIIEEGVNLLDTDYEESIEDTYTQVVVNGKDKAGNMLTSVASNGGMQSSYGVMQEIIDQQEATTQAELNTIAAQKLKELAVLKQSGSVKTLGVDGVEAGDSIYVVDNETGLVGGFYVESDNHTYKSGYHEMKLKLAWTDELPSIDYEAPSGKR